MNLWPHIKTKSIALVGVAVFLFFNVPLPFLCLPASRPHHRFPASPKTKRHVAPRPFHFPFKFRSLRIAP